MKRSDYNNFFDQVKCSEQFTAKMEELLKSERSEYHEYADNITGVEKAPKRRIVRYASGAAACLVLAGAVGTGYHLIAGNDYNSPDEYYSGVTTVHPGATSLPEETVDGTVSNSVLLLPPAFTVDYIESFDISEFESGWLDDAQKKHLAATLISIKWKYTPEAESFPENDSEFIVLELFDNNENSEHSHTGVGLHSQLIIREDNLAKYTIYNQNGDVTEYFYEVSDMYDQLRQITEANDPYAMIENSEYDTILYLHDASQTAECMEFELTDGELLKENLLSYVWEPVDYDDFNYRNFYIFSGFMLNEEGYMISNVNNRCYKLDGDASENIAKTLRQDMMMDDIAYLKYMLSLPEKDYSNMTADVEASYTVERREISGDSESYASYGLDLSGKLYDDRQTNSRYITAEGVTADEDQMPIKVSSISTGSGEWYIESGENVDKLNNTRSFYDSDTAYEYFEESHIFEIEASELNYTMLDERVLRNLNEIVSAWTENGLESNAAETDFYTCVKNDDGTREYWLSNETSYSCIAPTQELYVKIDGKGNIIEYVRGEYYETVFTYSLKNVTYDSEVFPKPEELYSDTEKAIMQSETE